MAAVNPFVVADVLDELKKVFDDKAYRKALCEALLKRRGFTFTPDIAIKNCGSWGYSRSKHYTHKGAKNAFGDWSWNKYNPNVYRHSFNGTRTGVEVVGLRPLAKGTTYSQECKTPISKLKKCCEMNGIKVRIAWKKVQYLQALMTV